MKKLGRFNLIIDNKPCTEVCKCGWNIQVGGRNTEDYKKIKKYLKNI